MTEAPVDAPEDQPPAGADQGSDRVSDTETEAGTTEAAKPSLLRTVVEWGLVIGGALLVALVIRAFLFTTFWIPSASMEPTLVGRPDRHDRVIVNRLSYKLHDVNRFDIIVFEKPDSEPIIQENGQEVKDLIKRVIGLPGETVTLEGGDVFVDGKKLPQDFLPDGTVTEPICTMETTFEVPEDSVLVMGDNRSNSKDGRCFGPVPESSIVGRAFIRIWPLSEITGL